MLLSVKYFLKLSNLSVTARPSIEIRQVTVTKDQLTVTWLYDGPARRRRRSTPGSYSVSVVIHYKTEDGSERTYPPDAVSSSLPATDRQANISGTFDVATPYIVWLTVYESHVLSHTTVMFEQLPLLVGMFLVPRCLVSVLPSLFHMYTFFYY